jgi:hypothetical protein
MFFWVSHSWRPHGLPRTAVHVPHGGPRSSRLADPSRPGPFVTPLHGARQKARIERSGVGFRDVFLGAPQLEALRVIFCKHAASHVYYCVVHQMQGKVLQGSCIGIPTPTRFQ